MHRVLALLVAVAPLCVSAKVIAGDSELFTIDDYFGINRVTDLALSSDGRMIAYVVESQSLEKNSTTRTVFISETTRGAQPTRMATLEEGRSFIWIPETHELAYLLRVDGTVQVISTDVTTGKSRRVTDSDVSVTAFKFAPDGSQLAWLTQASDAPATLYDLVTHGNKGIIIDSGKTVVYQFFNPDLPSPDAARTSNQLWLKQNTIKKAARLRISVPGKTISFCWSSNANKLSITYVDKSILYVRSPEKYTSLGVYDIPTGTFRSIGQGRVLLKSGRGRRYFGGEWVPGESRLFIHRTEEDGWSEKAEWSVVNIAKGVQAAAEEQIWHPIDAYARSAESLVMPFSGDKTFSVRIIGARPSLYEITPYGIERARVLGNIDGAISHVRFSEDFATAAFVKEDFDRPPEVHIWRDGQGVMQLTHLNRDVSEKTFPRVKEIFWQSKDGVRVQGWLLTPNDDDGKPWPLVTFVHGGPTFAFTNEFAVYFSLWPYPFESYAANGIAVFIPNYRGTGTFGQKFESPSAIDKEPVDDIISGIDYLIAKGVADPERLGISGHSHGAWLAALVMTKEKRFVAGSFAEGTLNKTVNYNLMPGWLNREVHDRYYGASLYDDPARYIELSPDMHFTGVDTAALFEAGAKSQAVSMMGAVKAALSAGMPAEFVVYPRAGHNLRIPGLQRESAERNLDWFRFWLQDFEEPDTEKKEQYSRWRTLGLTTQYRANR